MVNCYPRVVADLSEDMEIHRFSYKSPAPHWLHNQDHVVFHELPFELRRNLEWDKWAKTLFWFLWVPVVGLWARFNRARLVNVEETLPSVAWLARVFSGRPVILTGPDVFWDVYLPESGWLSWLRGPAARLHRFLLRRIDFFITHTDAFREFVCGLGVDPSRVVVIREACEPDVFHAMDRDDARSEAGYAEDEIVVLHHGIINPSKALDRILDWLAPVLVEEPRLRFVIAGDGPVRPALEARCAELGIEDRVAFLGWLPRVGDLNRLLNACDISLVMRSGRFSDHFHITANLFHSLTCGCCTLTASLDGIAEIVKEGENGLLFPPRDGDAFREQLKRLMADASLRRRLGEAAARTAEDVLSPDRVRREWVEAIRSFMNKKGSDRTL